MGPKFALAIVLLMAAFMPQFVHAEECGDGTCSGSENMCSCPADCGACAEQLTGVACTAYQCVQGACKKATLANCCGNSKCEGGEGYANCPYDCEPTSLELTILEPVGGTYFRGDSMLIKVKNTANGRNISSAELSATGPFGKAQFYNDGGHDDGLVGDNISAARVDIDENVGAGEHEVEVDSAFRGLKTSAKTTITVSSTLEITTDLKESYVLGETIAVTGIIKKGSNGASVPVSARITSASTELFSQELISSPEGKFAIQYRTSLLDKGSRLVFDINCSDSRGNHGELRQEAKLIEPSKAAFLNVELTEGLKSEYARGEEMLFKVSVKNATGGAVDAADVSVLPPTGGSADLNGNGGGNYEGTYRADVGMPLGMQEFTITANSEENGVEYSGSKKVRARIRETELFVEITEPQSVHFKVGETALVAAKITYPWGELAGDAGCVLGIADTNHEMRLVETGSCTAEYAFSESDGGKVKISVIAEDSYGNRGSDEREIDVSGFALEYLIMRNLAPILAALLALIVGVQSVIYLFGKKRRHAKLNKELLNLKSLRREIEDRYLNKMNIGREEFEALMQKYDVRIAEINKELGGGKK